MKTKVLTTILVLGFFALSSSTNGQTQKGTDIDGEAAGDHSGFSVSMPDANTIAIGARQNDGNLGLGADVGHVRVFEWNGTSWIQKGADIDGEATGDESGYSVSMPDENNIAIGTPYNDGNGADAGHVRVFEWNGTSWIQKGADIDGDSIGDYLGQSVSMPDANTVVMGATQPGATFDGGYVRIYQWNGTAWAKKGTDILSEAPDDRFGVSVSMPDTNTVAIGASNNDGNGLNAGHVRIYEWNGSDWAQKGTDIDGETQSNFSGSSVSMPDANTVAIGAPNNNGQGIINCGHVRVYHWNGVAWVQKGADIDGEATQDLSGSSVGMPNANTVAIGAYKNDGNGAEAGHVRVYEWNGTAWKQKELDIDGEAAGDESGYSVSMPDSNTIAIGARKNDGNSLNNSGHVRVYSYSLCTDTSSSSISPTACDSYVSPSGNYTWSISGTYMDTIPNGAGCDSVITINLTINTVDTGITNTSPTLIANATGATYQWLDCDNSYAIISGATNQSFTATANGNYAVQVTENGCTDTSACVSIINVGVVENSFDDDFLVFPNPTDGQLNIQLGSAYSNVHVIVRNPLGQQILNKNYTSTGNLNLTIDGDAGIYFVEIKENDRKAVLKVVKK